MLELKQIEIFFHVHNHTRFSPRFFSVLKLKVRNDKQKKTEKPWNESGSDKKFIHRTVEEKVINDRKKLRRPDKLNVHEKSVLNFNELS